MWGWINTSLTPAIWGRTSIYQFYQLAAASAAATHRGACSFLHWADRRLLLSLEMPQLGSLQFQDVVPGNLQ